ncbi:MAG: WG repeat-containing protein [Oscillospiraceae bacterium]|nr:WG repeat-containing protein [Oscillospiraceae bacterium]
MKQMRCLLTSLLAAAMSLTFFVPALAASDASIEVEIIPIGQYDILFEAQEGFLTATKGGYRGCIDSNGKVILPFEFEYTDGFQEGLIGMKKNEKTGFYNTSGQLVIPHNFDFASNFTDGLSVAYANNAYQLINTTGGTVATLNYGAVYGISDGMIRVRTGDMITGKHGYVNLAGKLVIPAQYDFAEDFSEGLAAVADPSGYKYGYIDKTGKLVIPYQFEGAYAFESGLAKVRTGTSTNALYGLIDQTGKLVVPMQYTSIGEFSDGYAYITTGWGLEQKFGLIDTSGKVIIQPEDGVIRTFSEGLGVARKNGAWGYINGSGTFQPTDFDLVYSFNSGLAKFKQNDKYGYIDQNGTVIVPAEYTLAQDFSDGIATASKGDEDYIIKVKGWQWSGTGVSATTPTVTATPTASTVLVNGKKVSFDAYNIGGNNYFKLRDLAYIFSDTDAQFEVAWDSQRNAIDLTSGKAYTAVGGEMSAKGSGTKEATATTSDIYLDGTAVDFTAYTIGGNNYFKLRDIGKAFDVGVTWDGAANTITIDTSAGYEE